MSTKQGRSLIAGVVLIVLGIVFLLNTLGLFPWHIWSEIWKLWPLILVAIGVKKILEK